MNAPSLRLLAAALLAAVPSVQAYEGMWMPQQLPRIAKDLKAEGLALDPARLAQLTGHPMGAVVSLGGCTASFVSPQGLVVTNHHCAYGSISFNSTPQRDLLKNGFLAQTFAEELPAAPGSRVLVTEAVRDVSAEVLDGKTRALAGRARSEAIEARQKSLTADCEARAPGRRCSVTPFFGGLVYQLIQQLEIRDVRLVHAPADRVGRFGGETDNWVWPRHTGDYSFYRAYVGKDGQPADYSADNQPYRPRQVLKLARAPLNEGDFVMVAGYPGRTNRLRLPSEVDFTFGWQRPQLMQAYDEQLKLIEQSTQGRRDAEIKLANQVQGLGNRLHNWQGQQASYAGSDILERKQADFAALKTWVQADAARRQQYGAALARVDRLLAERQAQDKRDLQADHAAPTWLAMARELLELAHQRELPNAERKLGFQDRDLPRLRQRLELVDHRYDEATEKRLVSHFLSPLLAQPDAAQHAFVPALGLKPGLDAAALQTRLDALYAATRLSDKAERLAWLERQPADFAKSTDPFIAAAVALYAEDRAHEARSKELGGQIQQAYADVMQAHLAFKASQGRAVYPDANGTLRISFGKVQGRPGPDGSDWAAFTTLRGIAAKHQGKGDFDAPAEQLEAIRARRFDRYAVKGLDSVPVNFLSSLDTTGGNSGSPVLNRQGELVGLLFDGTLDAVIADWDFNPKTTRSICLDARYMQWQMKVVDKADRLLKEMGAI